MCHWFLNYCGHLKLHLRKLYKFCRGCLVECLRQLRGILDNFGANLKTVPKKPLLMVVPPPSHPDPELEFAYTCFSTCCWNIFSMFEIFIWNNICGQNKKLTLVISMDIWADWFIITWKCESGSAGKPICGSVPKMLCSRRNHAKYGVLPFGDVSAWC